MKLLNKLACYVSLVLSKSLTKPRLTLCLS